VTFSGDPQYEGKPVTVRGQGGADPLGLNRAHPQKHDVAVLDFANDADAIEQAFADYYRTTVLSEETDPNKLHDL
jgi:hypothetical protein